MSGNNNKIDLRAERIMLRRRQETRAAAQHFFFFRIFDEKNVTSELRNLALCSVNHFKLQYLAPKIYFDTKELSPLVLSIQVCIK